MTTTLRNLCVLMTIMLWPMAAMAQTRYYVSEDGTAPATDTTSWKNPTTLTDALNKAQKKDEIWVKAGTYKPTDVDNGFTLRSGVQLYGGFAGTETTIDERKVIGDKAYRMENQTILFGDIKDDDKDIDATNLIFPENTKREDNAKHVLTINVFPEQASGNDNREATIVDGITIAGGHNDGGNGGGIIVKGDNSQGGAYVIRRCFFIGNYATQGGALYVSPDVTNANGTCLIDRCGFFNNAAGQRGTAENKGGAIYLEGAGTVVNSAIFNNENGGIYLYNDNAQVINSTVTRNTASGIDGKNRTVVNTVIWGNSTLSSDGARPAFSHCAYPEATPGVTDENGNVHLAAKNNEKDGPHFSSPSIKTGFDTSFDITNKYPLWTWEPMEATPLVDAGDTDRYNNGKYGDLDLNGDPRVKNDTIDIGAFEYQPVAAGRIRYVRQGFTGDGTSWENASGDIQRMIDNLAESGNGQPGEVWVAAGTYEPQTQLITGTSYSASFRMRDGISVYGGFAGSEKSKTERVLKKKDSGETVMPWEFENETILMAAYYDHKNLEYNNNKWTLTSDSRHVVWFAPMRTTGADGSTYGFEADFTMPTYLDGVTIMGGYAQGDTGQDEFLTDRGAGVYMHGRNTYLANCVVKENYATGNGGGVYVSGGRVQSSLIYNNNSDQNGGAVYVDDEGMVHRSMLTNNSARNGAGAYLYNNTTLQDGEHEDYPEYLILSTCVVSNNTASGNGAVYCDNGGVLLQNTITNNQCVTSTDLTDPNASQTGGIYINSYALVANSVIWNNRMGTGDAPVNIPMYAKNPTAANVRFMYNAISGVNNAVWNNTLQQQTLSLVDENESTADDSNSIGPRFEDDNLNGFNLDTSFGVQSGWKDVDNNKSVVIDYFWKPIDGSNLWARGMALGQLPSEVVLAPEIDIEGQLFAQKPAVGAFHVNKSAIVPKLESDDSGKYTVVLYVDVDCTEPKNDGSSWSMAYRSLNDAISYFSEWKSGMDDKDVIGNDGKAATFSSMMLNSVKSFEIRVLEGDLWPRYAFVNEDPKTATLDILKMQSGRPLKIVGGYYRNNGSNDDVQRDPLNHRSQLNGNNGGSTLADGLYHVVTVEPGARVELDGFHIINGYAAGTATFQQGAGMLVQDSAQVTLTNCIFENNTAVKGAALYAPDNATVTMRNCVVNNNTNTLESNEIIAAKGLTLQHVTVVNNLGAAPANENGMYDTSFSAGNTSGNTSNIETTGESGAKNFANPTNDVGATLGFDTYLGGYSSFRPLTSSAEAGAKIINQATDDTDLLTDITVVNDRNLGGVPDKGAYEAELPKAGEVLYVRDSDGDDNDGGLSWNNAFKTLEKALSVAKQSVASQDGTKVKEIWVAEGTYSHRSDVKDLIHGQRYAYYFVNGVNVYGGFHNGGAPGKDDRNPKAYETILQTADIDPETMAENGEKSYGRVLVVPEEEGGDSLKTETVYDGFTLQKGYLFSCYRQDIKGNISAVRTDLIGVTGGAGAYLTANAVLENCVIRDNLVYVYPGANAMDETYSSQGGGYHQAGAGVYNSGGVIRNCVIQGNKLRHKLALDNKGTVQSAWMYGAGLYMNSGTVFNTVICDNESRVVANNYSGFYETLVGTGAFLVNGDFYNNTIVGNRSISVEANAGTYRSTNITLSGVYVYTSMNMYNCIVSNNKDENGGASSDDNLLIIEGYPVVSFKNDDSYTVAPENVTVRYSCVNIDENSDKNLCRTNDPDGTNLYQDPNLGADYRLLSNSPAINTGTENIPDGDDGTIDIPDYDADYTNRIKDCAIDMGAYELDNKENIKCTTDDQNVGTYYVSQNGAGLRSGENPGNAACASKLQSILDDAGSKINDKKLDSAVVKVAGCNEYDENGNLTFKYSPTALASESDPQSYTFVVPDGVTVMGGYYEGDFKTGEYIEGSGWDEVTDEYKDNARNVFTFRTVLSAIAVPTRGSTITQEVNGYHAVTFGEWPGTTALTRGATIDGVWLVDGSATSMSGEGNPSMIGGGAIVPSGAHVRNCVVMGNEAKQGGGLYVLPGGTVSGTLVRSNTADNGGGIYADNGGTDSGNEGKRAHIISCTIADNTASADGGGLYLEDGASMQVNTVIWGNVAPSNKNVSGVTSSRYIDTRLTEVFGNLNNEGFYPFNDCFIESQEMPSDFENASMESDSTMYFIDMYRRLKEFSPLIKHGVADIYQDELQTIFHVADNDMQNIKRNQEMGRLDAGAFAYDGGILPDDLFTRIFVSQTTNVKLQDKEDMLKYLGKSFYTSFSTLEDALAYIRKMREGKVEGASNNTHFEILVGGGTYKPTYMRRGDDASPAVTHDQRLYSFVIPQNVSIYGGFSGTENYTAPQFDEGKIPAEPDDIIVDNRKSIDDILNERNSNDKDYYSDFNKNNIKEPWELANQTILSGNINASSDAKNAYHVVFSNEEGATQPVVLDGLTIMDGETYNDMTDVANHDEAGRGGGLYSNGVPYTINRCRFINNFGVRGGAVYMRDARLNVIGSIFAGNGTVDNPQEDVEHQKPRGGAIFLAGLSSKNAYASLYAVNSLFVNNETAGEGGVIGTNYAESVVTNYDPMIDIMNCTFAKNKAQTNAVIYNHNGKSKLTNTLIWGNESETYNENTDAEHLIISHSASDYNYGNKFGNGEVSSTNDDNNILLDKNNTGTYGPRFTRPATEAGAGGNNANNLWNPSAISVVTDKGDGVIKVNATDPEGAYNDWFIDPLVIYRDQYMNDGYERYSGPLDENTGKTGDKPIDIGVYEYQYVSNFQYMYAIYVATDEGEGDGSGLNWNNPTSDLRGAIVGASHPLGDSADRTIYVRDGVYELDRLSGGTAFIADLSNSELSHGLTIKGSCTGIGLGDDAQQNFANQSVIRSYEGMQTNSLLAVRANYGKYVTIEGFTFINGSGTGIDASTNNNSNSKFTLANSALRMNETGVNISANSGSVLIYNTLFADGGTGLKSESSGNITLVNTTFANNKTDMSNALDNVYNSVSWNNVTHKLQDDDVENNNKVFGYWIDNAEAKANNENIQEGPNFVDPLNETKELRDYHIRPSLTLLNMGSNDNYVKYVVNVVGDKDATDIPIEEVDLGNNARLTDGKIDIGAYEYEAPLQPIVYVKADVVSDVVDGKSWETALRDLQGAVDLVGIYAYNHKEDVAKNGYVFVHNNMKKNKDNSSINLRLTLSNTKVYGGMNDETSDVQLETDFSNVDDVVEGLLGKRFGLIERDSKSTLSSVTISESADNSVVDGILVNGTSTINGGCLSTSIVNGNVSGKADGILYNTLVYGDVSSVKAVNVTATGNIDNDNNNRANVTNYDLNKYVTDKYWEYQLNETDKDNIDVNEKDEETRVCQDMVGHNRDIAGNLRIRNNVDNGCFETWNITADVSVTDDDYPHGQSVVYVRNNGVDNEGAELTLERKYTASNPFNPGVLLLEHRAGLRVVGNGEQDNEKYGADGNNVGLSYVIVERDVKDGSANMSYIPFRAEVKNDGVVKLKRYDASKRAEYGYTLSDGGDGAWTDFSDAIYDGSYGLLLDNTAGSELQHVRFVGKGGSRTDYVYLEGKGMNAKKQVSLKSENHSDPWTTANPSIGHKFTAKENMSWNLFGSPYLCAMNYEDMEYGRVIYGYENDGYLTVNTDNADGETNISEGHIPVGDAIFTQTATLKDYETFDVYPRTGDKSGEPYASMSPLKLSIASTAETRAAEDGGTDGDVLQLNAVAPEMSRTDFDMGSDGVKWMADGVAQIYAVQGGGRYSLLSAVNIDGKVSVGVTLPEAGMYTIAVPDDCLADGYESVILEDAANGRKTNLLEGGYDFTSTTAGDIEGRFTISFNRMVDDMSGCGIRAWSPSSGAIRVEGVEPGDRISIYSVDGIQTVSRTAVSSTEDFSTNIVAVAVVTVERDGNVVKTVKLKMKY